MRGRMSSRMTSLCVSVSIAALGIVLSKLMCAGDTPFCEHRAAPTATHSAGLLSSPPEWSPGDDFFCDGELPGERSSKRPRSGDLSLSGGLSARLSRRWPSISKHWKDIKPTTAVSSATVRSAPPSRTTSMRLPSMRYSLATHLESQQPSRPSSHTPVESMPVDSTLPPRPRAPSWRDSTRAVDISFPEAVEDPIDRQGLASTPLLPPMMVSPYTSSSDRLNAPMSSPLQSPTVAEPVSASSLSNTPTSTPVLRGISTPPLSSRQSAASVRPGRSGLIPVSELPPLSIASSTPQPDAWASRLGHANFHISPEPYFPSSCTTGTCKGLLEDWEAARVEYLRLAAHVSEHYGQTSQTYKYTQAKWTGIDSQWRGNYERASSEAGARGEVLHFQPLAKTQLITMPPPSLDDPKKFPTVAEADIVGPMVQYTKIQRRPSSKKAGILRVFTDPASLLGGRSPWSLKR